MNNQYEFETRILKRDDERVSNVRFYQEQSTLELCSWNMVIRFSPDHADIYRISNEDDDFAVLRDCASSVPHNIAITAPESISDLNDAVQEWLLPLKKMSSKTLLDLRYNEWTLRDLCRAFILKFQTRKRPATSICLIRGNKPGLTLNAAGTGRSRFRKGLAQVLASIDVPLGVVCLEFAYDQDTFSARERLVCEKIIRHIESLVP